MTRYMIYDRKVVNRSGLDKAFLRSVQTAEHAEIYTGGDTESYLIKKVTNKQYDSLLQRRRKR